MQTPRRWGLPFSAGVLVLATLSLRPLRTSCWIVGTASPFSSVGDLRVFVGWWSSSVAVVSGRVLLRCARTAHIPAIWSARSVREEPFLTPGSPQFVRPTRSGVSPDQAVRHTLVEREG